MAAAEEWQPYGTFAHGTSELHNSYYKTARNFQGCAFMLCPHKIYANRMRKLFAVTTSMIPCNLFAQCPQVLKHSDLPRREGSQIRRLLTTYAEHSVEGLWLDSVARSAISAPTRVPQLLNNSSREQLNAASENSWMFFKRTPTFTISRFARVMYVRCQWARSTGASRHHSR